MSRCKSCGAPMLWAETVNGKPIPLDPEPRADGNLELRDGIAHVVKPAQGELFEGARRYVSHYASCPDADDHRRGR